MQHSVMRMIYYYLALAYVMDRDGWSGKSLIINTLLPFTHLRLIIYKSITTIKYKSYQRDKRMYAAKEASDL